MNFSWDPRKASTNLAKHKVSFEEADSVFSDPEALLIDDPDHSQNEDRFVLLGIGVSMRTLVVCHCYRDRSNCIRIISARKATRTEVSIYRMRR